LGGSYNFTVKTAASLVTNGRSSFGHRERHSARRCANDASAMGGTAVEERQKQPAAIYPAGFFLRLECYSNAPGNVVGVEVGAAEFAIVIDVGGNAIIP
jgi:hypothetical protein